MLPSPRSQLLINLEQDRLDWWDDRGGHNVAGAAISAPTVRPTMIDARQQSRVIGAVFRPGGLAGMGLGAPREGYLDLFDAWNDDTTHRTLHAMRAAPLEHGLRLLERLLRQRQRPRSHSLQAAIQLLGRPRARVDRVAEQVGMSSRRLARQFMHEVGLRPKQYARLTRFRTTVENLADTDLGTLAHQFGYADQAHLNHDFRDFTGLTPTEWRQAERPWSTHWVVR